MTRFRAFPIAWISSSSLSCVAFASRFWVFWIRNTMRKVTIVVPVLITSCQVSEKPKIGPVTSHTRMTSTATVNAQAEPMVSETFVAVFPIREALRGLRDFYVARLAEIDDPARLVEDGDRDARGAPIRLALADVERRLAIAPVGEMGT